MCNGCDSWFLCFGCVYSYFIIAVTGRLNVELRWNMIRFLGFDFVTDSVSIDFRVWKILFSGGFRETHQTEIQFRISEISVRCLIGKRDYGTEKEMFCVFV